MDDETLTQDGQDKLQHLFYTLHSISNTYNLKILMNKTKVMAFKDKFPVRTKIIMYNNWPTLQQIPHFNYLGSVSTYTLNKYLNNKCNM
jgi:hypothetical protein